MNQEDSQLLQLWHQAVNLKNVGEWKSAADLFEQILKVQPNWEHGYGAFNLAECYEELGRISDARSVYVRAVHGTPTDRTLLGGLASFLFLHGDPQEAFDEYIRLLVLERKHRDDNGMSSTKTALRSLGSRLGWSNEETESRITEASK